MARAFRTARQRLVASGRKTFWLSGSVVEVTLGGANSAALLTSLNTAALALRPFTVVRSRGYWGVHSDQVAADESQQVHYGETVVSEEALAVGISAVPTPVAQTGSSWIVFEGIVQRFEVVSNTGVYPNMIPQMHSFDSKAMRKIEEGDQLISVVENTGTSEGTVIVVFTRTLIKLH